jgi:membrane associated rhomboid family serine protease
MPDCISCGRELPSPNEPHNICPECRVAIMAHAQSSAPLRTRRAAALKEMPLTTILIAVNLLVFLAMALSGVSLAKPSIADLVRWGAKTGRDTLHLQPWRMLTSNYVHIGLLHIAFNMWCL